MLVVAGLVFASSLTLASETSVEPSGNGVDLLKDTTGEEDARSSETSAAAEELVDAVPAHAHDVPLADAVMTADGQAGPCCCWVLKYSRARLSALHGRQPNSSRASRYRRQCWLLMAT